MSLYPSPTTVHRGQDLGTINEDAQNCERTKSLELNTSGIETHHFNYISAGPKRRSTVPQSSLGPERETASINNGVPQRRFRQFFNLKGIVPNRTLKRQSTSNTHNSVITNASASFEETAVWDQKVLLALGMDENRYDLYSDMEKVFNKRRWRWYPWVLGASHTESSHGRNRKIGDKSSRWTGQVKLSTAVAGFMHRYRFRVFEKQETRRSSSDRIFSMAAVPLL